MQNTYMFAVSDLDIKAFHFETLAEAYFKTRAAEAAQSGVLVAGWVWRCGILSPCNPMQRPWSIRAARS